MRVEINGLPTLLTLDTMYNQLRSPHFPLFTRFASEMRWTVEHQRRKLGANIYCIHTLYMLFTWCDEYYYLRFLVRKTITSLTSSHNGIQISLCTFQSRMGIWKFIPPPCIACSSSHFLGTSSAMRCGAYAKVRVNNCIHVAWVCSISVPRHHV